METLPVPVDELVRVYKIYQKQLEKQREKTKTDKFKTMNREHAKRFYEKHKEEVLAKRHKYYEENKDEMRRRNLEAYYRKKATSEEAPAGDQN